MAARTPGDGEKPKLKPWIDYADWMIMIGDPLLPRVREEVFLPVYHECRAIYVEKVVNSRSRRERLWAAACFTSQIIQALRECVVPPSGAAGAKK